MKWFYNMKVGTKLLAGFIVVALIAGIIGVVGYTGLHEVGDVRLPSVQYLLEVEKYTAEIDGAESALLVPSLTYEERQELYNEIEHFENQIEYYWGKFEELPMTAEEEALWAEVESDFQAWEAGHSEFMVLSRQVDELGIEDPMGLRRDIGGAQRDHYNWIWTLSESISNEEPFTGQLDPQACALGEWLNNYETRSPEISALMNEIEESHNTVHESGSAVNDLLSSDVENRQEQAMSIYQATSLPNMNSVLDILERMNVVAQSSYDLFNEMTAQSLEINNELHDQIMVSLEEMVDLNVEIAGAEIARADTMIIAFTLLGVIIAVVLGLFIASNIKKPLKKTSHMLDELKMGHLGLRLNIDTKDELGQMARSMDGFADALQTDVVGSMQKISQGDVSFDLEPKDKEDEITPAILNTSKSIKDIMGDTQNLITATKEGKLDTRGDASKYEGSWQELLQGVNELVDAFVSPINVTAEYVERISKGDIPPRITDTYSGDFNEIKNNLNGCIDVMNGLLQETNTVADEAIEGNLTARADDRKFEGGWKDLIKGFNQTIGRLVGILDEVPIPAMIIDNDYNVKYMNKVGSGVLGKTQQQLLGTKCYEQFKTSDCNTGNCACSKAMQTDKIAHSETDAHPNGLDLEISYTGVPLKNREGNIIGAFEVVVDQTEVKKAGKVAEKRAKFQAQEIEKLIENIERVSRGDLNCDFTIGETDYDTKDIGQNHEKINESLGKTVKSIEDIMDDTKWLVDATKDGKLDTRGDASKYEGSWRELLQGVNELVDAFVAPINVTAEYVERISNGDMPPKITDDYKGDFNEIKNNLNHLIDATEEITEVASKLSVGDTTSKIEKRSSNDKMVESLQAVIDNFKHDAENLESMANGKLDIDIQIMSEADIMAKSTTALRDTLQTVSKDMDELSSAAIEGKLSTRADAAKHSGDFKKIVDGVNKTLDAVIKPIEEASEVLGQMAKGNLSVSVTGDYNGDHAKIKEALNNTIENVSSYIKEISEVLGKMSDGDMVVEINRDYLGDFVEIKNALNNIISSFNEVLSNISSSAEQVSSGSKQMSDSSQALSQGSTEQASSVEELSSSITEIATQTKENAANAEEANTISTSAKQNASKGNEQMKEMLGAMTEIEESSANISKIIKVIDEIAFQTNILALNAAVEAARAGQHGKGFAVVAEEVRNLAARSANAAKETTALIEGTVERVGGGTKIAQETAEALNLIVEDVEKTTEIVANIATASNEQATGISQVNRGIDQVSQVIQTNSATAEEGAAASEELSSQAQMLKDMVSRFKLKKTNQSYSPKSSSQQNDKTHANDSKGVIEEFGHKLELLETGFDKY